jgi:hypothetical protein
VYDSQHKLLGRGPAKHDVVKLTGPPPYSGSYEVHVTVPGCHAAECDIGLLVLRQELPAGTDHSVKDQDRLLSLADHSSPSPVGTQTAPSTAKLKPYTDYLVKQGYTPSSPTLVGNIAPGQRGRFSIPLTSGVSNYVVASCGQGCDNFEVLLYDSQHKLLVHSVDNKDVVTIASNPTQSGSGELEIAVPGCHAAQCEVAVLAMRYQPVAAQSANTPITDAAQLAELKRLLYELNFDPGPIDGVSSETMREAIRKFEAMNKLAQTGEPTVYLLEGLHNAEALKPWGTIVFDKEMHKFGMAWNEASRGAAVASAQKSCGGGANLCATEVSFYKTQCAAFAHSSTGWSIQTRDQIDVAKEAAMTDCETRGRLCHIVAAVCADGSGRFIESQ